MHLAAGCQSVGPSVRAKIRSSKKSRNVCESLEPRRLLSSIVWSNRGSGANDTDGFGSVFGVNVNIARSAVDAAISSWQNIINNFNYAGGGNTYTLTISMDGSGVAQGAHTNVTHTNSNGSPDAATIHVGRGLDTTGDGVGDGGGYYLNNTPYDYSPWTGGFQDAFVGYAPANSPIASQGDLYSLVLHEIGHAMGLSASSKMKAIAVDTGVPDTISGGFASETNTGDYWAVHGAESHALMTGFNSGGDSSNSSSDAGGPEHFAYPGAVVSSGGSTYNGAYDLMNAIEFFGYHYLISDQDAFMLADAYGYLVTTPDSLGTFYDHLLSDGTLQILTNNSGSNFVGLSEIGTNLSVSEQLGAPIAGADPTGFFTSSFPLASVQRVQIFCGTGNDTVRIFAVPGIPISVSGGNGNDSLDVEGASGTTTLTPSTVIGGSHNISYGAFENITVGGGTGNDSFALNSLFSFLPITINGSDGNDTLTFDKSFFDTSPVHFDGGTGTNKVVADETASGNGFAWGLHNGTADLGGTTYVNFVNTQQFQMLGGALNDVFTIYDTPSTLAVTCFGGSGDDQLHIGGAAGTPQFSDMKSNVLFVGADGNDSISLTDRASAISHTYNVFANSASVLSETSGPVNYDTTEFIELDGPSGHTSMYDVNSTAAGAEVSLFGGLLDDTFNVTAANSAVYTLAGRVDVNGGGGTNTLNYTESAYLGSDTESILLTQTDIEQDTNAPVDYTQLTSLVITGTPLNMTYYVAGTSPNVSGQTTIFCGNGNNPIYVFPHDASGNRTIASTIGIAGQGGVDALNVADQLFLDPIHYVISNPFGASTQDIGGMGTASAPAALVGAGNDIENISINAGDANDIFDVNSFKTGAVFSINGGAGNDQLNITPSTGDLSTNITSIGGFTFDGGDGSDTMNLVNTNSTSAWTYTENNTSLVLSKTAYHLTVGFANIENLTGSGGTLADTINITSTPTGLVSGFDGAGGNDVINIGAAGSTQTIHGNINALGGSGGNDSIVVDDTADTVGRTFHIDSQSVNAYAGDNLFNGGALTLFTFTGSMLIKCGSGADSVNALPNVFTAITLQGNNPTAFPGDTLAIGLAAATGTNFNPITDTYSFSNRANLAYSGFESASTDNLAPSVIGASFNYDAPVPSITMQFSENVSRQLSQFSIELDNSTSSATIDDNNLGFSYNPANNTATFTFPGLPNKSLPDGNYTATLFDNYVIDTVGNAMATNYSFGFFSLAADANHDRAVDATDLGILSLNWGQPNRTFSEGDFNYDGVVNVNDLDILASHWQQSLAAPALSPAAVDLKPVARRSRVVEQIVQLS
ncbi:MAG TPA: hypothetical protein VH518_03955 [Tepidisphaeraceae bacterium]